MAETSAAHPLLNAILLAVAAITGLKGLNVTEEELDYYNKLLSLILKAVSILSFGLLVLLNFQKVISMIAGWFKNKKNE